MSNLQPYGQVQNVSGGPSMRSAKSKAAVLEVLEADERTAAFTFYKPPRGNSRARWCQRSDGFWPFRRALYSAYPDRALDYNNEWLSLPEDEKSEWLRLAQCESRAARLVVGIQPPYTDSNWDDKVDVQRKRKMPAKGKTRARKQKVTATSDPMLALAHAMKKMGLRQAKVARAQAVAVRPKVASSRDVAMQDDMDI